MIPAKAGAAIFQRLLKKQGTIKYTFFTHPFARTNSSIAMHSVSLSLYLRTTHPYYYRGQ